MFEQFKLMNFPSSKKKFSKETVFRGNNAVASFQDFQKVEEHWGKGFDWIRKYKVILMAGLALTQIFLGNRKLAKQGFLASIVSSGLIFRLGDAFFRGHKNAECLT